MKKMINMLLIPMCTSFALANASLTAHASSQSDSQNQISKFKVNTSTSTQYDIKIDMPNGVGGSELTNFIKNLKIEFPSLIVISRASDSHSVIVDINEPFLPEDVIERLFAIESVQSVDELTFTKTTRSLPLTAKTDLNQIDKDILSTATPPKTRRNEKIYRFSTDLAIHFKNKNLGGEDYNRLTARIRDLGFQISESNPWSEYFIFGIYQYNGLTSNAGRIKELIQVLREEKRIALPQIMITTEMNTTITHSPKDKKCSSNLK